MKDVRKAGEHLFRSQVGVGRVIKGRCITVRSYDDAFEEISPEYVGDDTGQALIESGPVNREEGEVFAGNLINSSV